MLLLAPVFRLNLVLTAEIFVLICSILLLAYLRKSNLGKYFTYGAISIIVVMVLILICTLFNSLFFCGRGSYRHCRHASGMHGRGGEMSCCSWHMKGDEYKNFRHHADPSPKEENKMPSSKPGPAVGKETPDQPD